AGGGVAAIRARCRLTARAGRTRAAVAARVAAPAARTGTAGCAAGIRVAHVVGDVTDVADRVARHGAVQGAVRRGARGVERVREGRRCGAAVIRSDGAGRGSAGCAAAVVLARAVARGRIVVLVRVVGRVGRRIVTLVRVV